MAVFDEIEEQGEHKKKTRLVIWLIILMVVILGLITYLFFYNEPQVTYTDEPIDFPQPSTLVADSSDASASIVADEATPSAPVVDSTPEPIAQVTTPVTTPAPQPESKPAPIAKAKPKPAPKASAKPTTTSTVANLKYAIKPNNADIYTCANMRNGRWDMPRKCEEDILSAVQRLIDANNELIAIEISGIVDGNPYAGPSAELKQEGLASFRAREGIIAVMRGYSNVAAFEGPSLQVRGKRGFQVKAYYLAK